MELKLTTDNTFRIEMRHYRILAVLTYQIEWAKSRRKRAETLMNNYKIGFLNYYIHRTQMEEIEKEIKTLENIRERIENILNNND